jgi:hypothetical protein
MKLKFETFELTAVLIRSTFHNISDFVVDRSTYCKERGVLDDDAPPAAF